MVLRRPLKKKSLGVGKIRKKPSPEDVAIVKRALRAAKILGLPKSEAILVARRLLLKRVQLNKTGSPKKGPVVKSPKTVQKDIASVEGKKGDQTATLHRLK